MLSGCAATNAPTLTTGNLNNTEEELSCWRITGRMKVGILSLRGESSRTRTSSLSQGLQFFGTGVGMTAGSAADPTGTAASKLAQLESYNNKLKEMGCKSYDLQAELQQTDMSIMPRPQ